ncbi:protease modulator HflC [Marinivivus vitaminiproducens]|uniref:protease modulator HflC n=1 Tax=Marinivivus vitaminiproducens TaxID=3035935 RepID=UPI00279DE6FA|nr:protease modulator HflC [Geminicoccaceae bacterium SCSIO 64248]
MLNRPTSIGILAALGALVLILLSSLFTVHQTQQALVVQFGETKRIVTEPGLNWKLPFIQSAIFIDRRVLDFDSDAQEVILGDQKRLVVDSYARYRITDPLRFYQTVGNQEAVIRSRLAPILDASLRKVLGAVPLFAILSADRATLMNQIKDESNSRAEVFGIEIVDVRIRRADLPEENSQAIYQRMQTEREREARELRAQGAELGQRIRARAERERRVILAEAERDAQITRGRGDAEQVTILADAYGRDVRFFEFYRTMQAYRTSLTGGSTNLVMSPNTPFFRYFNDPILQGVDGADGEQRPSSPQGATLGGPGQPPLPELSAIVPAPDAARSPVIRPN